MIDLHSPSRTPTPPPNLNEKELNSTVCVEWECSRFKLLVCLLDQIARFLFFSRYHQRKELHFRTVKRKIPTRKKSSQLPPPTVTFHFVQTEMKTLKRRVTNFFSQCDKLVQFSSPDVQREVQCNIPVTPSVSSTFSTNLIHKCLGCSFNGAKEPHSDKGLTLETTALRWTCSSQSWFARS